MFYLMGNEQSSTEETTDYAPSYNVPIEDKTKELVEHSESVLDSDDEEDPIPEAEKVLVGTDMLKPTCHAQFDCIDSGSSIILGQNSGILRCKAVSDVLGKAYFKRFADGPVLIDFFKAEFLHFVEYIRSIHMKKTVRLDLLNLVHVRELCYLLQFEHDKKEGLESTIIVELANLLKSNIDKRVEKYAYGLDLECKIMQLRTYYQLDKTDSEFLTYLNDAIKKYMDEKHIEIQTTIVSTQSYGYPDIHNILSWEFTLNNIIISIKYK